MVEGEIGMGNGGIAVDDINFDSHITQEECRSKYDLVVNIKFTILNTGFYW